MNDQIDACEKIASTHIRHLTQKLRFVLGEVGAYGTISNGTWSNDQGIVLSYVSYLPHNDPREETIDATITLNTGNSDIEFTADICWSDGELISEVVRQDLGCSTSDTFLPKVRELCVAAVNEMFSQMRELITVGRPPRYREG